MALQTVSRLAKMQDFEHHFQIGLFSRIVLINHDKKALSGMRKIDEWRLA